jgi:hypothetical protein
VAAKNSECAEKAVVLRWVGVVSPARLGSRVRSSLCLPPIPRSGDSGTRESGPPSSTARSSPPAAGSAPGCSRPTACSGSCSTDCGRAVYTPRWCGKKRSTASPRCRPASAASMSWILTLHRPQFVPVVLNARSAHSTASKWLSTPKTCADADEGDVR